MEVVTLVSDPHYPQVTLAVIDDGSHLAPISVQQDKWVLERVREVTQEARCSRPIDDAVVAGERERQHAALDGDAGRKLDGGSDPPDREDGSFRRVENRAKRVDSEHPEVRDGEHAAATSFGPSRPARARSTSPAR